MSDTVEESLIAPSEASNESEKNLLEMFAIAKKEVEGLAILLENATKNKALIEDKLMRLLEDDDKVASAKYEGLGHVVIVEGAAYASIEKGRSDDVLAYLKSVGREDMIKTSVHSATLSSFVREQLKMNADLPPGVTFYKPKGLRFYPVK